MSVASSDRRESEQRVPLTPLISSRHALSARHVVLCAWFGFLFLFLNYLPLWHTDLWSHVAYGQWILEHGRLPAEDPFMPLAAGMQVVDSAWLSQVLFAWIEGWGGAAWLSNVFALVVLATYLILARVFYLQSHRVSVALLGSFVALAVGWSRLSTIRPEIFGTLCFALLCWLLIRCRADEDHEAPATDRIAGIWPLWLAVPALFILWANLHGSFFCGLALLGAFTLGRALEVGWQSRSLRAVLLDRPARRLLLLSELALLATLINPYGLDLLIYSLVFVGNANLRDVLEWTPLVILGVGGREFALSLVLLLVVWRHSRRTIRPREVILLAIFATAAVTQIRMLSWYAPIFALVVVPHLGDIVQRLWPFREDHKISPATSQPAPGVASTAWRYSLCCVLILWISFALSGLSQPILGGAPREPERLYGRYTPRGVTEFLRENPPQGQIWNPQWWGDWLAWDGPPGLQPFVTTMLHLTPREVWRGYMQIHNAQGGWGELLNRYRVTTIVVDKERQPLLAPALRQSDGWILRYEDDLALVFERAPRGGRGESNQEEQPLAWYVPYSALRSQ